MPAKILYYQFVCGSGDRNKENDLVVSKIRPSCDVAVHGRRTLLIWPLEVVPAYEILYAFLDE
jgi:hypothetical protein